MYTGEGICKNIFYWKVHILVFNNFDLIHKNVRISIQVRFKILQFQGKVLL